MWPMPVVAMEPVGQLGGYEVWFSEMIASAKDANYSGMPLKRSSRQEQHRAPLCAAALQDGFSSAFREH
jgi:hypothetical protein